MKLLNYEQRVYLFSLETKKKRKKFLLDCLIESVLSAEVKISAFELKNVMRDEYLKENPQTIFSTTTTAPRAFENPNRLSNKEILLLFNDTEEIPLLTIYKDFFTKEQNYSVAKLFKNKIEILELVKQMENE